MKDLIRRSTTKQLFLSKIKTKQTDKKAIISIYMFDRNKQYIFRRISASFKYIQKKLIMGKENIPNLYITKKYFKGFYSKNNTNTLYSDLLKFTFFLLYRGIVWRSIFIKEFNMKTYTPHNTNIRKVHMEFLDYIFYKSLLSCLNLHLVTKKRNIRIDGKKQRIINRCLVKNGNIVYFLDKKLYGNIFSVNEFMKYIIRKNLVYSNNNIDYMKHVFLRKLFFKFILRKLYKHINVLTNYINNIYITNKKLINFIPYLQFILKKVYNKRIEINIINLRYIHLNTDTFIQAMSIKLRNKANRITKILRKSLDLINIDYKYKSTLVVRNQNNIRNRTITYLQLLNINKGYNINYLLTANNNLNRLCSSLFFNYQKNVVDKYKYILTNVNDNIKYIKYKWITGICLFANGRLTKRYTASRAVHKTRYKGSLYNFDYLESNLSNSKPSAVLLKNLNKSNIDKGFIANKKRIGTFGIKGWISGN